MSDKNMAHHIANYRNLFIYLLIGTSLTVWASYLEFNVHDSIAGAIFVGLTIAIIKGYFVLKYFTLQIFQGVKKINVVLIKTFMMIFL